MCMISVTRSHPYECNMLANVPLPVKPDMSIVALFFYLHGLQGLLILPSLPGLFGLHHLVINDFLEKSKFRQRLTVRHLNGEYDESLR